MKDTFGMFFVLEGSDGSGKATQLAMLKGRLEQAGYKVKTFDFPQYSQPSSFFVNKYLGGKYGSAKQVGPYSSSLFFALDRFEAAPEIKNAIKNGYIVIANRFTASNMAYQSTMFNNIEQRRGFYIWLDNLEYMLLNIPRPDLNLYLRVPTEISKELMINKKKDINENNSELLLKSVRSYDELCQLFPKDFKQIDCVRSGALMSIENIHKMVWESIQPHLPDPTNMLEDIVEQENVKAKELKTSDLFSVSDNTKISLLLASKLGLVHLSDPTVINKANDKRRYYIPESLKGKIRDRYVEVMDSIFELQDEMRHRIKPEHAHLLSSALPLATTNSYIIEHGDFEKIYASNDIESYSVAKALSLDPEMLSKPKPDLSNTNSLLANNFDVPSEQAVTLLSVYPRNELDIVANILYPSANMPFRELTAKIESWPYDQKASVLLAYLAAGHDDARVLENIKYSFEINAPFTVLKELQTIAPSASFVWQKLTPRYGYDIPEEIENSGLADLYERCFDISLELFSELQAAGSSKESEYAVLQGHVSRFTLHISYSALTGVLSSTTSNDKTSETISEIINDIVKQTHSLFFD